MTRLTVYDDDAPGEPLERYETPSDVAARLGSVGVRFERWRAEHPVRAGDDEETILAAYREEIDRLMAAEGYRSADVVSVHPEHPEKDALRRKFLDEHTHAGDEVRFFVDGRGLFTLHIDDKVFEVLCERGDLIGVPAGTRHWFDMGPRPSFVAVRVFTSPEGWAAEFTGSDIADEFPRLEG